MKYVRLARNESDTKNYDGPFSVLYSISDEYSNAQNNFKLKYRDILVKEAAIQKADSLFN